MVNSENSIAVENLVKCSFLPEEKTHFMLSCLATFNMGNIVPRMAFRNGTIP